MLSSRLRAVLQLRALRYNFNIAHKRFSQEFNQTRRRSGRVNDRVKLFVCTRVSIYLGLSRERGKFKRKTLLEAAAARTPAIGFTTSSGGSSSSVCCIMARLATTASITLLALSTLLPQHAAAMQVHYCPDGRSMETGLCYARCPLGSYGIGCSCWRDGKGTWRGCGVRPRTCVARSFRRPLLPPVGADRGAFTLLLSADPQLFRNYAKYDDREGAEIINRRLVQSINAVRDLGSWPRDAGGGAVQEPRSMVVLGDLTEYYMERQQDAFRHFYDPSYPGSKAEDRVRFQTWLMLGVRGKRR